MNKESSLSREERKWEVDIRDMNRHLRQDPSWDEQRHFFNLRGLTTSEFILVAFAQDEFGNEFGAIVTKSGFVYEYERSVALGTKRGRLKRWINVTESPEATVRWPSIPVGRKLVASMCNTE